MDSSETIANLGTPMGVDLNAMMRELNAFHTATSEHAGEIPAIRACSCNLIIIVSDRNEAETLPPVLADVAEWHPCRSLVAFRQPDGITGQTPMQAWIRVQCRPQPGGGPQVCSEVITLAVSPEAAGGLPSALLSLLMPDLPVFLYWRSTKDAEWEIARDLARAAGTLIVDLQTSLGHGGEVRSMLALLEHLPQGVALRDLSWQRLTAWRDLIAQFFDSRTMRSLLQELNVVEIRASVLPGESVPYPALLLAGWLISRLDWNESSAGREGTTWISRRRSTSGEVQLCFPAADSGPAGGGVLAVSLTTRGGASFSVVLDPESECMTASAASAGNALIHKVPFPAKGEAEMLIAELSLPGEDAVFRAAFAAAAALEKSFH
jgi:glucose-6-phosphate dehydrogenase assembly protein OpcA